MEDIDIVRLYWLRSETAIDETSKKYGGLCFRIACNILQNQEDADECVNDTYFRTWNSIPDNKPSLLSAYLGKITRNLAINKWRQRKSKKRGGENVTMALGELEECIPSAAGTEKAADDHYLADCMNSFLRTLPEAECNMFLQRYWYMDSIRMIAERYAMSESKVKSQLFRTRRKMKRYLEKEGIRI